VTSQNKKMTHVGDTNVWGKLRRVRNGSPEPRTASTFPAHAGQRLGSYIREIEVLLSLRRVNWRNIRLGKMKENRERHFRQTFTPCFRYVSFSLLQRYGSSKLTMGIENLPVSDFLSLVCRGVMPWNDPMDSERQGMTKWTVSQDP